MASPRYPGAKPGSAEAAENARLHQAYLKREQERVNRRPYVPPPPRPPQRPDVRPVNKPPVLPPRPSTPMTQRPVQPPPSQVNPTQPNIMGFPDRPMNAGGGLSSLSPQQLIKLSAQQSATSQSPPPGVSATRESFLNDMRRSEQQMQQPTPLPLPPRPPMQQGMQQLAAQNNPQAVAKPAFKKGGKVSAKASVKKAAGGKVAAKAPVKKAMGGKVAAKPMPAMKRGGKVMMKGKYK